MTLADELSKTYRRTGHVTVPGIFEPGRMDQATNDAMDWASEVLTGMNEDDRRWYIERGTTGEDGASLPRKLDNPVFHRAIFRELAADELLLEAVGSLIGSGLRVAFSQIFFKPPGGGDPKPVHQDNFYFGCGDDDGMVTAWVALDEANVENGCMHFADGSNLGPVLDHSAPPDEPFNLLIPEAVACKYTMTPAPVPKGGVSFHHGNTLHQSADNRSANWLRAVAIHYINGKTRFATPALQFDDKMIVPLG